MMKMFADVCFPKDNEQEFVEIARRLSSDALVFLYHKKDDIKAFNPKGLKVFIGIMSGTKLNGMDFFYIYDIEKRSFKKNKPVFIYNDYSVKRGFYAPTNELTQVKIKEFRKNIIGLPFGYFLEGRKNPLLIEKASFLLSLCSKYKVRLFVASFANSPLQLRGKRELLSLVKTFSSNHGFSSSCCSSLYEFLCE